MVGVRGQARARWRVTGPRFTLGMLADLLANDRGVRCYCPACRLTYDINLAQFVRDGYGAIQHMPG